MMRSRLCAGACCSSRGRSMTFMRSSCAWSCGKLEPRKRFERIILAHPRDDMVRQMRRYRVVAIELPVRIVGGKQQHLVGADLVDDVGDALRIRRTIERLRGQADVIAHDR